MSLRTDAAILNMLPQLMPVEFTLLMALSQQASDGLITRPNYLMAINRVGLTEEQALRVLAGLALYDLAHFRPPQADRAGYFRVQGENES